MGKEIWEWSGDRDETFTGRIAVKLESSAQQQQ